MNQILNSLLDGVLWLVRTVLTPVYALPDAAFPAAMVSGTIEALKIINLTGFILPLDTIFTCVAIIVVYWFAVYFYKFVMFAKSFIPFIG